VPGGISTRATRYAEAAFSVAEPGGQLDVWMAALDRAANLFAEPAAERFLTSPVVAPERKEAALAELLPGLPDQVSNFFDILIRRDRLDLIPDIRRVFRRLVNEHRGVELAQITTARPIDQRQQELIAARLATLTGKRIEVETQVDPSILGGVVAHVGDNVIDGSIRGRLERLRRTLTA
jgi:F-type H+-transporting ATPase subunit delta